MKGMGIIFIHIPNHGYPWMINHCQSSHTSVHIICLHYIIETAVMYAKTHFINTYTLPLLKYSPDQCILKYSSFNVLVSGYTNLGGKVGNDFLNAVKPFLSKYNQTMFLCFDNLNTLNKRITSRFVVKIPMIILCITK